MPFIEMVRPGLLALVLTVLAQASSTSAFASAQTVAFLGLRLQNDNAALEPTTDAEKRRIKLVEKEFTHRLEASGRYRVLPMPADVANKIESQQAPGECNGCEVAYAKEIGGDVVAWLTVQKVSNLILNLNLFMGDVASNKMTFVHSVDIRGNTDESWTRSLDYLLTNYLFAPGTEPITQ